MTIHVEIKIDHPTAFGYSLIPCSRVILCSDSVSSDPVFHMNDGVGGKVRTSRFAGIADDLVDRLF